MIVRNILSQKPQTSVLTISSDQSITQALSALAKHGIGALVVSNDGNTVDGILSERDIVREFAQKGAAGLQEKVSDVMTSSVVACHPGDSAVSVLERMTEGRFRHMPVVEDEKMIGVISIGDVVKARISEVEHENSALTDMIAGHV